MAQVVRQRGFVGPLILLVVGAILLLNGIPAVVQWMAWVARTAVVVGTDSAIETAAAPIALGAVLSFIGLLLVRGSLSALARLGPQLFF